jgi:hypothetical protein
MTVPAAVPKEMLIELLAVAEDTDDGDEIAGGFVAAIKRLQHLEQLAERMTGAREALEDGAKSLESDAASWRKDCGSCAPAISRESSAAQLRSLIASLGETK